MNLEILRQFRFGPFTFFDTLTAYIGIFLIAPLLTKLFAKMHLYISRSQWLWLTLPIGLAFHLALHLNTPFTNMFLHPEGFFFLPPLIILFMLFMGVRQIKNPRH